MKKHKVFLTGATGKFGRIIMQNLLELGYSVVFTSRSQEKINKVIEEYNIFDSHRLFGICVDLQSSDSHNVIINELEKTENFPTVLINNARNLKYLKYDSSKIIPLNNWLSEFHLDVIVAYNLSYYFSKHFSQLSNIINISSIYGVVSANPNLYDDPESQSPINYSVCKAALIHLTKELAVRLAKKEIRVNAISYGGLRGRVNEKFEKRYGEFCPMGRMLTNKDIFGPVNFLLSDASSGITGHNLLVDGGWTIW